MKRPSRSGGFTLIELLVVIAILGLLIATFAPDIFGARTSARIAADQANLRWHYMQFERYSSKHDGLPAQVGHKFVLAPWVDKITERTPQSFERYWSPEAPDPHKAELAKLDPDTIWQSFDELTSEDTHYAGPGDTLVRRLRLGSGKVPLMSNDNEYGPAFEDHTINILMADGHVGDITIKDLEQFGFVPDADSLEGFPIGADSPHPDLKLLQR